MRWRTLQLHVIRGYRNRRRCIKAGEVLLDYIKGPFKEMAFFADKDTEFALAELANDAGICGAAKLVLK